MVRLRAENLRSDINSFEEDLNYMTKEQILNRKNELDIIIAESMLLSNAYSTYLNLLEEEEKHGLKHI